MRRAPNTGRPGGGPGRAVGDVPGVLRSAEPASPAPWGVGAAGLPEVVRWLIHCALEPFVCDPTAARSGHPKVRCYGRDGVLLGDWRVATLLLPPGGPSRPHPPLCFGAAPLEKSTELS